MNSKTIIFLVLATLCHALVGSDVKPGNTKTWMVRATTNASVPSASYILDAVECLRQAISVYNIDDGLVKFYAELYEQKHPGYHWNVVAGYTALYLNMDYYVETILTPMEAIAKSKENLPETDLKLIIFAAKEDNSTRAAKTF